MWFLLHWHLAQGDLPVFNNHQDVVIFRVLVCDTGDSNVGCHAGHFGANVVGAVGNVIKPEDALFIAVKTKNLF